MSKRELLELAAKAAGIDVEWVTWAADYKMLENGCAFILRGTYTYWNPLIDSGDALDLAVKLNMCVTSFTDEQMVGYVVNGEGYNVTEAPGSDPYAATRRAIVKAAAEIGRSMK